jgi:hypothetical protein
MVTLSVGMTTINDDLNTTDDSKTPFAIFAFLMPNCTRKESLRQREHGKSIKSLNLRH